MTTYNTAHLQLYIWKALRNTKQSLVVIENVHYDLCFLTTGSGLFWGSSIVQLVIIFHPKPDKLNQIPVDI